MTKQELKKLSKLFSLKYDEIETMKKRKLKINWNKSLFLCPDAFIPKLEAYLADNKNGFALSFDEERQVFYLFGLRVMPDAYTNPLTLAFVLKT